MIILVVLFRKISRRERSAAGQKKQRFDYQPEAKPVISVPSPSVQRPVQKAPGPVPVTVLPKQISIIEGRADITASLLALVEKYGLLDFTIATSDGLVFASSGTETAPEDAARYGERYSRDPRSENPGVMLFGLNHKGSDLVGIVRTQKPLPDACETMIANDTKDILNRWI